MDKCYLYIVLTRTSTIVSNLIYFATRDEYTHAAISLDENLNDMYSFARKNTNNPFIGRFKKEDLNEGVYKFSKILPGAIIKLEVTQKQYERARELIKQFIKNSDVYKYNYKGLIYSLLKMPVCRENRFLCSEFVYYILNESGIVDFSISRNLVRPIHLLNIHGGKVIFKGDLKEYRLRKLGYKSAINNEYDHLQSAY